MITPQDCDYLGQLVMERMNEFKETGNMIYWNKHNKLLEKLSYLRMQVEKVGLRID